jgi:hypothetical protein
MLWATTSELIASVTPLDPPGGSAVAASRRSDLGRSAGDAERRFARPSSSRHPLGPALAQARIVSALTTPKQQPSSMTPRR